MGWDADYSSIYYNGPDFGEQGFLDEDAAYGYEMEVQYADMMPPFDRENVDMFREMYETPVPEGTPTGFEEWSNQVDREVTYLDGVRTIIHTPRNPKYVDEFNCALMYFHGGAGIVGTADSEAKAVDVFTVNTGCTIFNVDYRRAPENPAPAGMEDGYKAYNYLWENSY